MPAHHTVKSECKTIAGSVPLPNFHKIDCLFASEFRRIKTLMGNRITPGVQNFQMLLSLGVSAAVQIDTVPKLQPQAVEVVSYITRRRVAFIKPTIPQESAPHNALQSGW